MCPSDQICFFLALLSDKNKLWKKNWKELSREIHGIISPCRWLYPSINDMSSILVNPCKISPDSNAAWALILHNGRRCFRLNCFYASICMSIHMPSQWYLITVCIVKNFRGKISVLSVFKCPLCTSLSDYDYIQLVQSVSTHFNSNFIFRLLCLSVWPSLYSSVCYASRENKGRMLL